ncbi:MAG: sialidase family protein, partial [Planctomycetota bacterium]|nr:sialidase family protein [Planctomycetota bacterium]
MTHRLLFTLALSIGCLAAASGDDMNPIQFRTDVFVNDVDGYSTYRIPALSVTPSGRVLAFCEARRNSHEDTGDIDLICKHSDDGGRTWSPQRVIHSEAGAITIGNPCPILDRSTGTIHLLMTRDYTGVLHTSSSDGGETWTPPRDITASLAGFDYPLAIVATGPCHGIQLADGRLMAPVWMCDRTRADRYNDVTDDRIRAGTLVSDDHGATWRAGGLVPATVPLIHEATVAECSDGSVLISTRAWRAGARAVARSTDGGDSWGPAALDPQLPDPTC